MGTTGKAYDVLVLLHTPLSLFYFKSNHWVAMVIYSHYITFMSALQHIPITLTRILKEYIIVFLLSMPL